MITGMRVSGGTDGPVGSGGVGSRVGSIGGAGWGGGATVSPLWY